MRLRGLPCFLIGLHAQLFTGLRWTKISSFRPSLRVHSGGGHADIQKANENSDKYIQWQNMLPVSVRFFQMWNKPSCMSYSPLQPYQATLSVICHWQYRPFISKHFPKIFEYCNQVVQPIISSAWDSFFFAEPEQCSLAHNYQWCSSIIICFLDFWESPAGLLLGSVHKLSPVMYTFENTIQAFFGLLVKGILQSICRTTVSVLY